MIEFKKNVKGILPYDREVYIDYLNNDYESFTEWNGISFQLNTKEREIGLIKFFEFYEPLLKNILSKFDNDSSWIVNLDYEDQDWFPNEENNLRSLRELFKKNNISNSFKGAVIFKKEELLEYSRDLISFPFAMFNEDGLLYSNLDISNDKLKFIIKISGHLNIDFLSTDRELLKKIANENSSNFFRIKEYRGTSL